MFRLGVIYLFFFVIYFCGLYVLDYLYSSGHIWQALV